MTQNRALIAPIAEAAQPRAPQAHQMGEAGPLIRRILAEYRGKTSKEPALRQCLALVRGAGPQIVRELLLRLAPAWRDHAIACVYAILLPRNRRKRLGVYFTPPHLVDHLVSRLEALGLDISQHRLKDPAAGGAAFLVPIARLKVRTWRQARLRDSEIITRLQAQLSGCEIDPDLAKLANALLRRMLAKEFQFAPRSVARVRIIATGDSFAARQGRPGQVDHEIGNPPYLRLPRAQQAKLQAEFLDITNGRLNLYAMFIRRALDHVPPGGLVGYVIPTSFLGGPEFMTFRKRINELAEVLVIDMIEKRDDVFLDATQDACFIVLRRMGVPTERPKASRAKSGLLRANGVFQVLGDAAIEPQGEPWHLPGVDILKGAPLSEWGYRGSIGYLVANRQSERLHAKRARGRYPLIWAKAISPDGEFDFNRGVEHKARSWVSAPSPAPYIVRTECVAVQRTSSRGQKKRLTAAVIPRSFVEAHGGIVAENHVILLIPCKDDVVDAHALAVALNSVGASEQLNRVCGSASISVRLLEKVLFSLPQGVSRSFAPVASSTSAGGAAHARRRKSSGRASFGKRPSR